MGENPQVIDPELEKARKSMGGRIDPDDAPEEVPLETPVEPVAVPPKEPEAVAPLEPKEPVIEPKDPADVPPVTPARPEAYIPLPKYHSEKKDWETKNSNLAQQLADANKKVEDLTTIAGQKDGADKDADIEEFMATTGFDRETVEGFLTLAEKRLSKGESMSPEEREAVTKATAIVAEAEIEVAFNKEFSDVGEPAIKKLFPTAAPEKLALAKDHLDKLAHTAENKDKPLDFLVFKAQEELAKIFAEETPAPEPQTKKTVEPTRMGNGRQTTLTAADFKADDADFALLGELDQSTRSEIIKNFDARTYAKFISYAKNESAGVEVMREGRRVVLK